MPNIRTAALSLLLAAMPAWALTPAEITARLQGPETVQGQFVQQRFIKSLAKPMQTQGRFALKKRTGLFWHIQKPLDLQLRVREQGIAQWDAAARIWRNSSQSGQAAQVKLFMAVLGGDTGELGKQFTISANGNPNQWRMQLTPKTAVMKQIFQDITIQGGAVVQQIELREKQGDRTVMIFSQTQTDQPLSAAAGNAFK
ncbi:outer membrane lipoprotein carrier protein LolA [Neisseria sp. ZJ106]|uniref:Outer membrane lipoprotein carrier protein LolA n=1 Tax=Neisseria lisongii TaxID=2912188 RepID=A0ABY7RKT3_9NEIS|nr:outer membrane lipoprotein carrier protein LolA [Neisseria lisongii]MCF7521102.1 outer membrane lipoprotein carrier protein LolA [Neisseria lisongii]WCL72027.1 outer membrane lipoprotein carrier protein LolA [Neisseria lisongii]